MPLGESCRDWTSAIAHVLLCLEGHMAKMSLLPPAFPHIGISDMKTVILVYLIVKNIILGC